LTRFLTIFLVLKISQNSQMFTLFFIQFHSSSNTITVPIKCVHEQNNIRPELYQNFINQNNQEYISYARHLQTINNYLQQLPPQVRVKRQFLEIFSKN